MRNFESFKYLLLKKETWKGKNQTDKSYNPDY